MLRRSDWSQLQPGTVVRIELSDDGFDSFRGYQKAAATVRIDQVWIKKPETEYSADNYILGTIIDPPEIFKMPAADNPPEYHQNHTCGWAEEGAEAYARIDCILRIITPSVKMDQQALIQKYLKRK